MSQALGDITASGGCRAWKNVRVEEVTTSDEKRVSRPPLEYPVVFDYLARLKKRRGGLPGGAREGLVFLLFSS